MKHAKLNVNNRAAYGLHPNGWSISVTQEAARRCQKLKVMIGVNILMAGCGGGNGDSGGSVTQVSNASAYSIGGRVSGLVGSGLTLSESTGETVAISANGLFSFQGHLPAGLPYSVSVRTQPSSPLQTCTVANGSGSAIQADVTDIEVVCVTTPVSLTGRTLDFASGELGDVVADPFRNVIYVAAPERNELIVLGADTYLVTGHFFVGSAPRSLRLSADGSRLYVGLNEGGAIAIVDPNTYAVRSISVATQLGTPIVTAVSEVSPGVVLVGGSGVGNAPVTPITVDTTAGDTVQAAGGGLTFSALVAAAPSPNSAGAYLIGDLFPSPSPGLTRHLISLRGTSASLAEVASVSVSGDVQNVVVSEDGKNLLDDEGTIYESSSLQRTSAAVANLSVGQNRDRTIIMQTATSTALQQRDGTTFAEVADYRVGCPASLLGKISAAETRGEWMLTVLSSELCVVSTTSPEVAPGVDGSRALPPVWPDSIPVPSLSINDGHVNDLVVDNGRNLAYIANGAAHTVDLFSLATQALTASISISGLPSVLALSDDGRTLYVGLSDQGAIALIDRQTNQITGKINLEQVLGNANVHQISEVSNGHLIVSALPDLGQLTFLVDVIVADTSTVHQIGCSAGYGAPGFSISPDKHYLYVLDATTCSPEKRDLTVSGYPVVATGPKGGYVTGGRFVVSADGTHLFANGLVIDARTLQQTALLASGVAIASSHPDRYYLASNAGVLTIELHDLKIVADTQATCSQNQGGLADATLSQDETTFFLIGEFGDLCELSIPPS